MELKLGRLKRFERLKRLERYEWISRVKLFQLTLQWDSERISVNSAVIFTCAG